jgi:hypothetical protein
VYTNINITFFFFLKSYTNLNVFKTHVVNWALTIEGPGLGLKGRQVKGTDKNMPLIICGCFISI